MIILESSTSAQLVFLSNQIYNYLNFLGMNNTLTDELITKSIENRA